MLTDDLAGCPGCSNPDVPAAELCEHDGETGPMCLARCCERFHPVGRMPWEVAVA